MLDGLRFELILRLELLCRLIVCLSAILNQVVVASPKRRFTYEFLPATDPQLSAELLVDVTVALTQLSDPREHSLRQP